MIDHDVSGQNNFFSLMQIVHGFTIKLKFANELSIMSGSYLTVGLC